MKLWKDSGELTDSGQRFRMRAAKALVPLFRGLSARECIEAEAIIHRALQWTSTEARMRKMVKESSGESNGKKSS